ncbi:MAG: aldehyde dehydrogenase family protein [Steroidobacteraceae bacterium]
MHRMAHMVRAGQVSINSHSAVDVNTMFGGYKHPGWSREYGSGALDLDTETKTITARP